jgi:isochorismate pyruvate lyase
MKNPKSCVDISEIRLEIDKIDFEVLKLLAERQKFVDEIVKFKTDEESVVAADRQKEVYEARRRWANEMGLSADIIEEIYRLLIQHNIKNELERLKK